MNNILFWFRNDLRLHDNEAFIRATDMGRVIPAYVLDYRQFDLNSLEFRRTGVFRAKFILESLQDLRKNLQAIGSDLIIRVGKPEEELVKIAKEVDALFVVASKEVTQEETSLEFEFSKRLKPLNIDIDLIWCATLYHVRDLPFQIKFLPDIFTDFRKIMDGQSLIRKTMAIPENIVPIKGAEIKDFGKIPTLKDLGFEEDENYRNVFFEGGETAGLKRLHEFIWEKEIIKTYKETRNGLLGNDFSSKLSPWISMGCISPRRIYEEVKKYEKEVVKNDSTYWVVFELIWRDYFHFVALKYGIRLFKSTGIQHDMNKVWRHDPELFEKWSKGMTGIPFVDANMRELNATGYMSNRGRQIVSSLFTKDLKLQWWWGAKYFENRLIDYDVCSNWGNWNYIAGIGNDPRPNRYFNIALQAEKYDKDAAYMKHWLPELAHLTAAEIHGLHHHNEEGRVKLALDYPAPVVVLP